MTAYAIVFSWFIGWLFLEHRHRTLLVSVSLVAFLALKYETGYDWQTYYAVTEDFYRSQGANIVELLGLVEIIPLAILVLTPVPEISYFLLQLITYSIFILAVYRYCSLFDVDANAVLIFYFLFLFFAIFSVIPQILSNAFFILGLHAQFTGRRGRFYGFLVLAVLSHLSTLPFCLFAVFFTSRSVSEKLLMVLVGIASTFILFDFVVSVYLQRVIYYLLQIDHEKSLFYFANWLFILFTYVGALIGIYGGSVKLDRALRNFVGPMIILCLVLHLIFVLSNTVHNRVFYIGFIMALPILVNRQFALHTSLRYLVYVPASILLTLAFFSAPQSGPFLPYQTYVGAMLYGPHYGNGPERNRQYWARIERKRR